MLHVVTSRSISSSSAVDRSTPCLLLFISINSSAKMTLHSSPSGIALYTSPRVLPISISSTSVFPVIFIRLRKFSPVGERQSLFTDRNIFLSSIFSEAAMLFTNFMYLSNNANRICLVEDNGSMKYLCDCLAITYKSENI